MAAPYLSGALPSSLPAPRLINPESVPPLRWGILGPGGIAETFVDAVKKHTQQRVVAAGSSSFERARAFCEKFDIPKAYGNYEDLLADAEIDVIYVATRQHVHRDGVLAAIASGKHVLVEKPMTTLLADAYAIRDSARASDVFVMEAMWTTYLPQSSIIRQLVSDGVMGDIRFIQADLGQDLRWNERLFELDGGGASHDLGIYPTAFVSSLLPDRPKSIQATGELTENGLDAEICVRLAYENGASAYTLASMINFSQSTAWVDGSNASLSVSAPFPIPSTLTLFGRDFNPPPVATWTDTSGIVGHEGLSYEATALAQYVSEGLRESPLRNLDATIQDIEIITEARQQIGAFYPGEMTP